MIWVVGSGYMAKEYLKVLADFNAEFKVIGRGEESAKQLSEELNVDVISGGIENYLETNPTVPTHAIVCVPVDALEAVTKSLIEYGVRSILLEKPGALSIEGIERIQVLAQQKNSHVVVGYNRRFYQSVLAAEKLIEQDGGVTAINFEITEWGHLIADDLSSAEVKNKWVLANTSHVIDLVFYIGGIPAKMNSLTSGSLDWHKSASRFVGSGYTSKNILFSYMGYWDGPGRWSIEFITTKSRYILRPMEKLAVQKVGSIAVEQAEGVDYDLDESYKPGLFLQTKAFLDADYDRFCSLEEQKKAFVFYNKIAGY